MICSAFELSRRRFVVEDDRPVIGKPAAVYPVVAFLCDERKEHLVGLYLDAQNKLIHKETLSIGSLNTTRTHPREIMYPGVAHGAMSFILAHNHPSGNKEPSEEDIAFTKAVTKAGDLMGIELFDHLIIARGGGFTSMRERGLM